MSYPIEENKNPWFQVILKSEDFWPQNGAVNNAQINGDNGYNANNADNNGGVRVKLTSASESAEPEHQ